MGSMLPPGEGGGGGDAGRGGSSESGVMGHEEEVTGQESERGEVNHESQDVSHGLRNGAMRRLSPFERGLGLSLFADGADVGVEALAENVRTLIRVVADSGEMRFRF